MLIIKFGCVKTAGGGLLFYFSRLLISGYSKVILAGLSNSIKFEVFFDIILFPDSQVQRKN
jgi:hypothetical protein